MNLARRLTLTMVGAVLCAALLIGVAVDFSIQRSLSHVEPDRLSVMAQRQAAELETLVRELSTDLLAAVRAVPQEPLLAARVKGTAHDADLRTQIVRVFSAAMQAHPEYVRLRIVGGPADGSEWLRLQRSATGASIEDLPVDHLQADGEVPGARLGQTLGLGEVAVSSIEPGSETGQIRVPMVPVLRAATPLRAAGASPAVLVIVEIEMRDALERLRNSIPEATVMLVDPAGHYLVHPRHELEFAKATGAVPGLQAEFPALASLLGGGRVMALETPSASGERLAAAMVPVRVNAATRWQILVTMPSSRATTARNARLAALVAALLAALGSAAVAYSVARSVTRPLKRVTAAAQNYLDTGKLDLPSHHWGEIGQLVAALEHMQQALGDRNAELEREERRFRLLFEASASALLKVDPQRRIVLVNRQAELLFGYSREELLGQSVELLVPEPAREAHPALADKFFEPHGQRGMSTVRDLTARRKDGTVVAVEVSLSVVEMPDGRYALASINDVSERKRDQDELRRSNAELEQFAYVASHDLQEPLRMVVSYTELLAQRYRGQLDEKADKYIFYAVDGARRMQQLIRDQLAYSRVGSQGKPLVPVAVAPVLQRVLNVMRGAINDVGGTIESSEMPVVMADEGQLDQLFQNLIGNAIKFRSEAPLRIAINVVRRDDHFEFSVKDNGIGMDMKYAERIFQMFQRLHERGKYEGSGIGLAIVKRIVERHGGKVWLESSAGNGATFYFTLMSAPPAVSASEG